MTPPGFLQVDVDGLWAVRACYGRPERDSFVDDPCWTEGVPRLSEIFARAGTPSSFFIVGRDLELDTKRRAARKLLHAGCELGNHSYTHRLGLTMEPTGFILKEIMRTDRALRAIGAAPTGFRSPGYDIDARILRAAHRCGYRYDASMLPTYLAPALRLADAWIARRRDPNKRQFGRFVYGRAPHRPYFPLRHKIRKPAYLSVQQGILEIPVGTTPHLRLPLTAASLLSLSTRRLRDMFRTLAERGRPVLLLLHAIDGVDCRAPIVFDNRRPSLGGFSMSGEEKERRVSRIVDEFARAFSIVRADEFAAQFIADAHK
ncbi:polysaccharide deacetylase family protein [soil metagenome]